MSSSASAKGSVRVGVSLEVYWLCLTTSPNAGKRLPHRGLSQGCGLWGLECRHGRQNKSAATCATEAEVYFAVAVTGSASCKGRRLVQRNWGLADSED